MDGEQMLQQTNAIDAIARELGVDRATAQAGAAALLPSILSGFQKPEAPDEGAASGALSGLGGLGGLLGSLSGLGGGGLLDNVTSSQPTEVRKSLVKFLDRKMAVGPLPQMLPRSLEWSLRYSRRCFPSLQWLLPVTS